MKGKDLIKWIQDNKAEDLDILYCADDDDRYASVNPAIESDGYSELSKEHYAMYRDDRDECGDYYQLYDYELPYEPGEEKLKLIKKWVKIDA